MEINIGFKFSKQFEMFGKTYWKDFEIIGMSYGLSGGSRPDWKTKEDVLKLKKFVQVMSLPYPLWSGLNGLYDNMENSQLSIYWEPLKELQKEIEEDMKLLPEHRKFKID